MRRSDRIQKKFAFSKQKEKKAEQAESKQETRKEKKSFYNKYYKQLLIIPFVILLAAIVIIGAKVATTGDFIEKGISLKGGTAVTVISDNLNKESLMASLESSFPDASLNIRTVEDSGVQVGLMIESDISADDQQASNAFIDKITSLTGATENQLSVETTGAALGESFFKQAMISLLVAFVLMAIVVFFYFRIPVPSALVVLSAVSNIIITIAVLNVLHIKIGSAGIAALLMLIGYSVDTDVLLTMRVLKRKEGKTVYHEIIRSMKTGIMMTTVTFVAVVVAMFIANSPVLKEILTVVIIGLLADLINTWIQNTGLLRWYLEKKGQF